MKRLILMTGIIALFYQASVAQNLMDLLNEDSVKTTEYTYATFFADRIVLGQSIENPPKGALVFVISHHFGPVNSGPYDFFGLDQANIRFGFEYGFNDWFAAGIGRSSVYKTYDGFLKFKILRQSKGLRNMPFSLTYWTNIAITALKFQNPEQNSDFGSRMEYAHQLLIARKFSEGISFQLTPTFIHRNLVETKNDQNDVFAIGAGGRVKISKRTSINAEYFYLLPGQTADDFNNSFSVGVDLETGGHVFQIFLTNSQGLLEEHFIPRTEGSWGNGFIRLGFNVNRTFQLKKPKLPTPGN